MHAIGATIPASHATSITNEILGISNGNPGQTFQLEQHPILARRPEERIEVREPGSENWVPWIEVEHFYRSTGRDRHYTLDGFTGEIAFGPTIREPQGVERIYGARPLTGSTIRMSRYRVGGGTIGNAGPLTISQLKTSVPYVDRVINHAAAQHGLDAEQLEQTMLRAPHELWNSERAVTTADYEFLALKASPRVARASCIQPGAAAANQINSGVVRVVIVPRVDQPDRIDPQHPEQAWKPDDDTPLKDVHAFLSERRLLTTQLVVEWPEYVLVSIHANLRAIRGSDPKTIETEALRRLYRFLNPLVGGPQGDGWPFGRNLTIASIYAQLQNIADLEEIESVQIRVGNQAISATTVAVGINAVVRSGEHRITVKRAGVP
jgi:predicted phage baseplate assembly protein